MRPKRGALGLAAGVVVAALLASGDALAVKNNLLLNVMKRMGGFAAAGDMRRTLALVPYVRAMGPSEYSGWQAATEKVAAAARAGDSAALKTACNGCHDQYREAFRNKYGSKSGGGGGGGGEEDRPPVPVER